MTVAITKTYMNSKINMLVLISEIMQCWDLHWIKS